MNIYETAQVLAMFGDVEKVAKHLHVPVEKYVHGLVPRGGLPVRGDICEAERELLGYAARYSDRCGCSPEVMVEMIYQNRLHLRSIEASAA